MINILKLVHSAIEDAFRNMGNFNIGTLTETNSSRTQYFNLTRSVLGFCHTQRWVLKTNDDYITICCEKNFHSECGYSTKTFYTAYFNINDPGFINNIIKHITKSKWNYSLSD